MNLNTENLTQTINQLIKNETPFPQDVAKQILEDKSINILSILASAYELEKNTLGILFKFMSLIILKMEVALKIALIVRKEKTLKQKFKSIVSNLKKRHWKKQDWHTKMGLIDIAWCHQVGVLNKRIDDVSKTIKKIKERYPIEVCLSTGFINEDMAVQLKNAV